MVKRRMNRMAWALAAILAVVLLGGIGLLAVRMGPYWEVKYRAGPITPGTIVILRSTSSVPSVTSGSDDVVTYTCSAPASREVLEIPFTPGSVSAGGRALARLPDAMALDEREGYAFERVGSSRAVLLWIRHDRSAAVAIRGKR
jgi:hypothetical protein